MSCWEMKVNTWWEVFYYGIRKYKYFMKNTELNSFHYPLFHHFLSDLEADLFYSFDDSIALLRIFINCFWVTWPSC